MMCCIGPAWAVLGYFLGRWCLFAWKPLDYPDAPRWMVNPERDFQRRWLLGLLVTLVVLWWVPLLGFMLLIASNEPRLIYLCLNVVLVGYGSVRWLDRGWQSNPARLSGWSPVTGRWRWGLLVALGMLGLVWQYLVAPR